MDSLYAMLRLLAVKTISVSLKTGPKRLGIYQYCLTDSIRHIFPIGSMFKIYIAPSTTGSSTFFLCRDSVRIHRLDCVTLPPKTMVLSVAIQQWTTWIETARYLPRPQETVCDTRSALTRGKQARTHQATSLKFIHSPQLRGTDALLVCFTQLNLYP